MAHRHGFISEEGIVSDLQATDHLVSEEQYIPLTTHLAGLVIEVGYSSIMSSLGRHVSAHRGLQLLEPWLQSTSMSGIVHLRGYAMGQY